MEPYQPVLSLKRRGASPVAYAARGAMLISRSNGHRDLIRRVVGGTSDLDV